MCIGYKILGNTENFRYSFFQKILMKTLSSDPNMYLGHQKGKCARAFEQGLVQAQYHIVH